MRLQKSTACDACRVILAAFVAALMFTALFAASPLLEAQTYTVIHDFTGGADGAFPYDALTVSPAGVLYGTAAGGGTSGNGTVFELKQVDSNWVFSPLYAFTGGTDGSKPIGGVVFGPDGALYGTTQLGGADGDGVVFSLRPPNTFCRSTACPWNETLVHTFTGVPDGINPWTENLIFDAAGNIYGTTGNGGTNDNGTTFELSPSGSGFTETILHSFGSGSDGRYADGGVVVDPAGNVYGTTEGGGPGRMCSTGCGTVYEISPSNGSWQESVIYNFGVVQGYYPNSDLIRDAAGNLYGTAIASADYNQGVLFKLAPTGNGFFYSLVHQFHSDCEPYGAPVMDSGGNFFGTCIIGGVGGGWVYELTNCSQTCTVIDLHDFSDNGREGYTPWGGATLDANGNLYGTAQVGGTGNCNGSGCGVVWEIAGVGAPQKK